MQLNCQINPSSFPSPSDNFLFETRFLKSLLWRAAVILRNSTHTPHAAVTLPNNRQDKYHRVSEIPGGSSSNFSPTTSTLPQEKELRTRLNTMRGRRNTVVGCRNFFYSTHGPNQFANNPTSALRLQVERTIKNDRFWPQGNFLSFSSSPNVWAETPETSQTRDFKTKAFKNAEQRKKGSHRRKLWPRPSLLFHP